MLVLSEKSRDLEWRENRTAGRARNHCANGKLDTLKSGPGSESLLKQLQNGEPAQGDLPPWGSYPCCVAN